MDNIKETYNIDELYSVLPWHKKIQRRLSEWFDTNILHFKFPWKKLIVLVVIALVICGLVLVVKINQTDFPVRDPYNKADFIAATEVISESGQTTTLENDSFQLVFNNSKTTFQLIDKRTGETWYSNPEGASSRFQNPLQLYYAGSLGQVEQINVIDQAVDYDDYSLKITDNSIEVLYYVGGKKEVDSDDFPEVISAERMEELILSKLEEGSTDYRRITEQAYVSGVVNGESVWKLKDGIQKSILKQLYRIMYEVCGYNETELAYDQEVHGILVEDRYPYFEIAIRYELTDSGLQVILVNDSIVEKEKYPLIYADVLPLFGCGTTEDEGYIFVPDGSGGLIDFNNNRSFALPYNKRIFGNDYAKFQEEMPEDTATIRLPVIGIQKNDEGFISIIEQGAEMASVLAKGSTVDSPYNQAYYRYHIREGEVYEFVSISSSVSINEWTRDFNTEDLVLNYQFIADDKTVTYNEMADQYREYLLDEGILVDKDLTSQPTVDLTLLGGYTSDENILGIPYETIRSLTSTEEALEISENLIGDGVTYLNLIYSGMSNEGLKPTYMGDIDFDRRTGTKNDMIDLAETLEILQVNYYPEAYANTAYTGSGFNEAKMAVKDVFGKTVYRYGYDPASLYQDVTTRKSFTLNPNTYASTVAALTQSWEKIQAQNIAFADYGNQVYGNYKKGEVVFRNEAVALFESSLESSGFSNVLFRDPNLYAIQYATVITDVHQESSNYQVLTDSIPFYQLVFSGYIDYSGESFNTNDAHTYDYNVMKAIETASNISMTWSYHSTIDLVDTEYSIYYSTYYLNWYETLLATYEEMISLGVYGSNLAYHEILTDDGLITKSTYQNGMEIVFNYRDSAYLYGGQTIEANQYMVIEEGV